MSDPALRKIVQVDVSRQIHSFFADYTPLIEPLSLDETYLDVMENLRGLPTASKTAMDIRCRILEGAGLTASAGISYKCLPAAPFGAQAAGTTTSRAASIIGPSGRIGNANPRVRKRPSPKVSPTPPA
jgi:hypothetical protein